MRFYLAILTALLVAAGSLVGAPPSHAQAKADIVIGMQCDRTGATQIVGTVLCPGFHDYIALVNSKGGVEGHKIKALEIDHEYKPPRASAAPPPPTASAIPTSSPSPPPTGRRRRPRWTS